jgi:methylaspartate ammonia-lyase
MMPAALTILDLRTVPIRAGFFFDDQAAIRAGAEQAGFAYAGTPVTPGFTAIRQAGDALSVLLYLSDGSIVHGDCAAVQYSGAGGRDPLFEAAQAALTIAEEVAPLLIGTELTSFRELAERVDRHRTPNGLLHTAIRYGVTQALLAAAAHARRCTMAEIVRDEYQTGAALGPVPIFAQTGDDRYRNAEKMILKRIDVLPHALINNVETKLGRQGEILEGYLRWLTERIEQLRPDASYQPRLYFDTYGTIGLAFGDRAEDVPAVAAYLDRLGKLAEPFQLVIEHPVDAGSRDAQIEIYVLLRAELRRIGSPVQIAVDEWCNTLEDIRLFVQRGAADVIHVKTPDLGGVNNTIEALLLVTDAGLVAYCGGTCNETDRSAVVSAHIAMACTAGQILAKPGMGVDEGVLVVGNEMARVAAIVGHPAAAASPQAPQIVTR